MRNLRKEANAVTTAGCYVDMWVVTRAGLVIGHTGHFPGGSMHFRGRQKVFFFFFFAKDQKKQRAASGPLVCLLY